MELSFLLPMLVEKLLTIDLYALARNQKSTKALRTYIASSRWTRERKNASPLHDTKIEITMTDPENTSSSSTIQNIPKQQHVVSAIFYQLRTYIEQVSAFLNDLNDFGASKISGASDGSRSGGAPSIFSCFKNKSYLKDANIPFDHIYVLQDCNETSSTSNLTRRNNLHSVTTPKWYSLASDIYLSIITGQLSERKGSFQKFKN